MATRIPETLSQAVARGDVVSVRQALVDRILQNPAEAGEQLPPLVAQLERAVPELWEDDDQAAPVKSISDGPLYFEALIAELRLHFAPSTWDAVMKAAKSLGPSEDPAGASRWVSIVIVLALMGVGALILFGSADIRYLFSSGHFLGQAI
jgi:hypothetical protein